MKPQERVTTALLAAKLAKESLALLTLGSADLVRLQFRQIVRDLKALDEHIKKLGTEAA